MDDRNFVFADVRLVVTVWWWDFLESLERAMRSRWTYMEKPFLRAFSEMMPGFLILHRHRSGKIEWCMLKLRPGVGCKAILLFHSTSMIALGFAFVFPRPCCRKVSFSWSSKVSPFRPPADVKKGSAMIRYLHLLDNRITWEDGIDGKHQEMPTVGHAVISGSILV